MLKKNAKLGFLIIIHILTIQNNGSKYLQMMATKLLMCWIEWLEILVGWNVQWHQQQIPLLSRLQHVHIKVRKYINHNMC